MSDLPANISARTDAFVRELDGLVRAAAIAAVRDALGNAGTRRSTTATSATAASKSPRTESATGNAAASKFLAYVRANPGERTHVVCGKLGIHTDNFRYTLNKWLRAGVLKKRGTKRGTRYYPGTAPA